MPFTMPNFRALSPEEVNPMAGAISGLLQGAMKGPELYKSVAEAKYAPETAKATADYKEAMAQYLSNPNQALRFLTPLGKTYIEPSLIKAQLARQGVNISDDQAKQFSDNINSSYTTERQKISQDPVLTRQASAAQNLYGQISKIDSKPLETFSGFGGKLKLNEEKLKGIGRSLGLDFKPSEDFRNYSAFMSVNKNAIMDAIRQTLATSVQPKYVMDTLLPMLTPDSPAWSDPEQVRTALGYLKDWSKQYAEEKTTAASQGVPSTVDEFERRSGINNKEKNFPPTLNNENLGEEITDENGNTYVYRNGEWMPLE